jgi:hypothetical protein
MMTTNLIIKKDLDEYFKQLCQERGATLTVIEETPEATKYEMTHFYALDLWYMGYFMGMEKGQMIYKTVLES